MSLSLHTKHLIKSSTVCFNSLNVLPTLLVLILCFRKSASAAGTLRPRSFASEAIPLSPYSILSVSSSGHRDGQNLGHCKKSSLRKSAAYIISQRLVEPFTQSIKVRHLFLRRLWDRRALEHLGFIKTRQKFMQGLARLILISQNVLVKASTL